MLLQSSLNVACAQPPAPGNRPWAASISSRARAASMTASPSGRTAGAPGTWLSSRTHESTMRTWVLPPGVSNAIGFINPKAWVHQEKENGYEKRNHTCRSENQDGFK